MPDERPVADTLKDIMLYGAFVGALWSGVVSFVGWWEDKYQLFWNTIYGFVVALAIALVMWLVKRRVASPIITGDPQRVFYFTPAARWTGVGVTATLLLFALFLAVTYWDDLHGIVTTPELAVVEAGNLRLVHDPLDENLAKHWVRYAIDKNQEPSAANTAFGALILDFTKKESCKYAEIASVIVVVERYQPFKSPPQEISGGEGPEVRILDYSAMLEDRVGTFPAKLTQQPKLSTPKGNPVIGDALPVCVVVAVRGNKDGLYTVRGEIVVRYHGKKETIRSDKSVTLACFKDGAMPKPTENMDPK